MLRMFDAWMGMCIMRRMRDMYADYYDAIYGDKIIWMDTCILISNDVG